MFRFLFKPKPGTIMTSGDVVGLDRKLHKNGPCFVPRNFGTPTERRLSNRIALYQAAGWKRMGAVDWPGILPQPDAICVGRGPVVEAATKRAEEWQKRHAGR
jgi:hypothetical protein